jgi:hypothetical protein
MRLRCDGHISACHAEDKGSTPFYRLAGSARLNRPVRGNELDPANMPLWWNGRHTGLRNQGFGMRVQISLGVLAGSLI